MNNDQTFIRNQLNQKTEKERREERQRKQSSTWRDENDSLTNKGLNYFDTQKRTRESKTRQRQRENADVHTNIQVEMPITP